jgi:hypothetical protein
VIVKTSQVFKVRRYGVLAAICLFFAVVLSYEKPDAATESHDTQSVDSPAFAMLDRGPGFGTHEVSTDEFNKILPLFYPRHTMSMPGILHCIRIGQDSPSEASDPTNEISHDEALARILDAPRFGNVYDGARPYLVATLSGARFSEIPWSFTFVDKLTREAHWGQTLSVLAELGVPSSQPIRTSAGENTLLAVIDDAVANFSFHDELHWISVALAMYLPPQREWTNKYGETFTFSKIAERLMAQGPGESRACGGTHTLYTLAVLLQVHEKHDILFQHTAKSVRDYLKAASDQLSRFQQSDGSWGSVWTERQKADDEGHAFHLASPVSHYLWMTGHHLEWQAVTPTALRIPRDQLAQAARYVVRQTQMITVDDIIQEPCRYAHGPRAVQLLLAEQAREVRTHLRENKNPK